MNLSNTIRFIFVIILLVLCLYIYNTKKNEVLEEPQKVQVLNSSIQERINETYIHSRTYKEN